MNKKTINYEAPEVKILEMVLENGIAYTITKDGYFEFDDFEEGDDLGVF